MERKRSKVKEDEQIESEKKQQVRVKKKVRK